MNQLSETITKYRESRGWKKSEMARQLGISSQLYGQYENSQKKPGADFFILWRQKFGSDLLETIVSEDKPIFKEPLETAIQNLTEADLINARNIERLISLLETKYGRAEEYDKNLGTSRSEGARRLTGRDKKTSTKAG